MTRVDLSIRQLSTETRLPRDTVAKILRDASVQPSGKRGGHPVYRLRDALDAIYSAETRDPEQMTPVMRHQWYQGEAKRLQIRERERELCDVATVVNLVTAVTATTRDQLSHMPARRSHEIAAELGVTPGAVAAALEKVVRTELTQAARDADAVFDLFKKQMGESDE